MREVIGFVADILGIFAYVGITLYGINNVMNFWPVWLKLVLGISIVLIIRISWYKIGSVKRSLNKIFVERELSSIQEDVNLRDISSALPSTRLLTLMYNSVLERIRNWDKDALIGSVNMYFEYGGRSWHKPKFQIHAKSISSEEIGVFYWDGTGSETFEGIDPAIHGVYKWKKIEKIKPFFIVNANWRDEIESIFNIMKNKFASGCKIQVTEKLIAVYYKEGVVDRKRRFFLSRRFKIKKEKRR